MKGTPVSSGQAARYSVVTALMATGGGVPTGFALGGDIAPIALCFVAYAVVAVLSISVLNQGA